MQEDFTELLQMAAKLKDKLEDRVNGAFQDIEKIEDKKTREFFKNSLSLAKNGTLNVEQFIKELQQCQK